MEAAGGAGAGGGARGARGGGGGGARGEVSYQVICHEAQWFVRGSNQREQRGVQAFLLLFNWKEQEQKKEEKEE